MYKITVPVYGNTAYEHKEKTLFELKRCKADRVAIALDTFFIQTLSLKSLKVLIEYFENNCFEVIVWINTFGHDRINPPIKDAPYDCIEYMDCGKVNSFCPMGKAFLKYYTDLICGIASCGAKMIMLDDDFRMGLGFGCCCDMHMEAFCKDINKPVAKENLKYKLLKGGKNKYRSAWLKVQGDGLRYFAKELRIAVDKIDPNIRMGACVTMGRWDADGAGAIEIAKILAGKTKPFMRTFGAPYHTTLGFLGNEIEEERFLGNIVEKVRTQLKWCEQEDIEVFTEGDTYPRPRFSCPSFVLECYDTILRADGQSDGILKYMIDYNSSPGYETGYIDFMVKNETLYKEIESMFSNKNAVGVHPYLVQHTIEDAYLDCDNLDSPRRVDGLVFDDCSPFELLTSNCIPCTYEDDTVKVVFGESARHIPDGLIYGGIILDIVAAKLLMERGIDVGIEYIDESIPLHKSTADKSDIAQIDTFYKDIEIQKLLKVEKLLDICDKLDMQIIKMLLDGNNYDTIADKCFFSKESVKYRIKKYIKICKVNTKSEFMELINEINPFNF